MTKPPVVSDVDPTRSLRDAFACFATGVTVVTTQGPDGPLGFTANSFSSVSLDPPLILWCPARSSLRHDTFANAPHFAVHIMAEDQQDLAMRFARNADDFSGQDWQPSADGVPLLNGTLACFECKHFATHPAGDHSIVVGEILRYNHKPGKGLVFKQGAFGSFLKE